jgi:hypothetical protein
MCDSLYSDTIAYIRTLFPALGIRINLAIELARNETNPPEGKGQMNN